jgi:glycosyltransferase involved in cell wall biosynthesis
MTGATPRVTVVVPTFNSGRHLGELIASLDRQSLRPEEFEVVLVDDGSSDGTEALVDRIAEARPNVRAVHIPASGWPGRPRNVGLDEARGEFVYFVDHDDHLGDEALERMTDYGRQHGSDVVIGREVRVGRGPLAPKLFAENRPKVDLSWEPLWGVRTPHKMFRRQFLLDSGVRFPEGPRRLEDHAFIVPVYFAASTISVLADYPCYYWVFHADREHSSSGIDPDSYYPFLEEVLDLIEKHTDPGPERDKLLSYSYSTKVLAAIGRSVARWEPSAQEALLRNATELARTRFADSDAYLQPARRLLSHLVRAGRSEDVLALAGALRGLTASPYMRSARWSGADLLVDVALGLRYADGEPLQLSSDGDRLRWVLPFPLADVPDELLDLTDAVEQMQVSALLHRQSDGVHHPVDVTGTLKLVDEDEADLARLEGTVTVRLDPTTADFGRPLGSGRWYLRVSTGGFGAGTSDRVACEPDRLAAPALLSGLPVIPYASLGGNLALAVDHREAALLKRALPRPDDVHLSTDATGARVVIDLPGVHVTGDGRRPATLRLGGLPLPATVVASDGAARVESWFSALPGTARLELELDGTRTPLKLVLKVGQDGTVVPARPAPKPSAASQPRPRWRRAAGRLPGVHILARKARRALR